MVGRLPIVTGSPVSAARRRSTATDRSARRRRTSGRASIRPVRAGGSRPRATPPRSADVGRRAGSNFASSCRHAVPSIVAGTIRASTPAARCPARRVRPKSPAISRPTSRTSNPDRRRRRPASRAASRPTTGAARSAIGRAGRASRGSRRAARRVSRRASARGLSSVRTASQSTPFIRGSKCVSRTIFHAASNVSTGAGPCASDRPERRRAHEQRTPRRRQRLTSRAP